MSPDSNTETSRRTPWPVWFAAIAISVPILYVCSLAPVWRLAQPSKGSWAHRFYGPVFSLMEQTPLRSPLLAWCGVWGVREKIERKIERRSIERIFDTDILSRP